MGSGLRGKALRAAADKHLYPTRTQVVQAIPKHCFQKDTARSMMYAAISTALTFGWAALGAAFLPMTWAWAPVWAVHAFISGTFATGMWVAAHECGHGAFSDNKRLQDVVATRCTPSSACRTSRGSARTTSTTSTRTTWRRVRRTCRTLRTPTTGRGITR